MTRTEHLLTILAEECVEVAQRASKALRFGLQEVQPGQTFDNADRIVHEYAHIVAAIDMLRKEDAIRCISDFQLRVIAKTEQVEKFLAYSAKQGTLQ